MKQFRVAILGLLIIVIVIAFFLANKYYSSQAVPNQLTYKYLNDNLKQMVSRDGINKTADTIEQAFKSNQISIDQCHDLLHIVGHTAYEFHPNDWALLTSLKSNACLDSYQHGVEAQIVLEKFIQTDVMISTLKEYCQKLKTEFPDITCYHGVGHALVQETRSISVALKYCDMVSGSESGPNDCYRGAFSEYVNELKGIDGDTNAPIPGVTPVDIPAGHEFDTCYGLAQKYQNDCISQFTSFIYNGNLQETFVNCAKFPLWVAKICIHVSASTNTLSNLPTMNEINIPKIISSFSNQLKQSYIDGVFEGLTPYRSSDQFKKVRPWCESFILKSDQNYCLSNI